MYPARLALEEVLMQKAVILTIGVDSSLIDVRGGVWESASCYVTSAHSIREAIDYFQCGDFDLVLMGPSIAAESKERLAYLIRASGSQVAVACICHESEPRPCFADAIFENFPEKVLRGVRRLLGNRSASARFETASNNLFSGVSEESGWIFKDLDTPIALSAGDRYRNRQFSTPDLRILDAERELLKKDLQLAVDRNEITVQYQPKVDLATGVIVGAEALSRWNHPTKGEIPPSKFIPIAEATGQMISLGDWVLRESCSQVRKWNDSGGAAKTVTVNISAIQLESQTFVEDLLTVLEVTGLDPGKVELDIPTNILMTLPEPARASLRSARDQGIHVSADNFGQDEHCLSNLRNLPLDAIKIDRSFIRGIAKGPNGMAKVSAIIKLGRNLNLQVVAEGVETSQQLEFLWDHSCDGAQGYYFGYPMIPEKLQKLRSSI
jgi:EAL domain-containing protein (putative c-di-GMP-specific phosphodiesterase class I)